MCKTIFKYIQCYAELYAVLLVDDNNELVASCRVLYTHKQSLILSLGGIDQCPKSELERIKLFEENDEVLAGRLRNMCENQRED